MISSQTRGAGGDLRQRMSDVGSWCPSLTALAAVLALLRLALVVTLPYDRAVALFEDDAFYYFGIARNLASGVGSTFNGLDATNGYHPLWQIVLVPVFAVAPSDRAALVGVSVISAVLFVASALLFDRLGRVLGRPLLVTVGAAPLLVLGVSGPAYWFSGMETGLLLLLVLAVAVVFVRSDGLRAPWFDVRHAAALGVLIGLVVLARLDAVFPMLLFGALATGIWFRRGLRELLRLTVALASPPALLLAAYLAVNQLIFGTPLPVSGQAKALGHGAPNVDVLWQFLAAPTLFAQPTWLGALAVVVVPLSVLTARRGSGLLHCARFALVVLVGGLATIAYYALTSSWMLWPWYFYAAPLAIGLAVPALLDRLPLVRSCSVIAAVACAGVLMLTGANTVRLVTGDVPRAAFVQRGPEVAARLAGLAPQQAALAMGDRAGSVGFHLDRPLVHLEGLVNSPRYLDALREGRVTAFLNDRGVVLYGRSGVEPGRPVPGLGTGCHAYREPQQGAGPKVSIIVCDSDLVLDLPLLDGTSYRIWRYWPELNS